MNICVQEGGTRFGGFDETYVFNQDAKTDCFGHKEGVHESKVRGRAGKCDLPLDLSLRTVDVGESQEIGNITIRRCDHWQVSHDSSGDNGCAG